MSQPIPKFCPIHLKIHVCEEQTITNRLNKIENDLGAKVRKLHGIQTEEDVLVNEKKYKNPPGSLGAILEQAKANIAKQKLLIKTNSDDLSEGKEVSEQEVSNRIEALKLKLNGGKPSNINLHHPITTLSPPNDIQEEHLTPSPLDIAVAKLEDEQKLERDYFTKEETEELIKVVVSDILSKQKKTPSTTKKTANKPKPSSKIIAKSETKKSATNEPKPSSKKSTSR